jgi:hypothetical protein
MTTFAVSNTPPGGEPRDFISVMLGFLRQFTASLAYSRAGKAYLSATSASDLSFSASFDA